MTNIGLSIKRNVHVAQYIISLHQKQNMHTTSKCFAYSFFVVGAYTRTIVSWILTGSNPLNIQIYFTFNRFPNYACHILSYLLYCSLCKSTDIPAGHTLRKRVSSRCDITFTNKTFPITKHSQNQSSQLT